MKIRVERLLTQLLNYLVIFLSRLLECGGMPSDFEVACGRAGIDLVGSTEGSFHVGSPESSPASDSEVSFQFPAHAHPSEQEAPAKYVSVDPGEEELIKCAAIEDLARIFQIEVVLRFWFHRSDLENVS